MAKLKAEEITPNAEIDAALSGLMERITEDGADIEVAVKVINSAIAWEKVKHKILDKDEEFDPDSL